MRDATLALKLRTTALKKQYRKKPVVVEAVQWTGANASEVAEFMGEVNFHPLLGLIIPTLSGTMAVQEGEFIVKGVAGEFYPCHPDIFAATYEPA